MVWKVLCAISVIAVIIIGSVLKKIRQNKIMKRLDAAYELLKDEALDYALSHSGDGKFRMDQKVMLQIVSKKLGIDTVFDPEEKITIGRARDNMICLNSAQISAHHCAIMRENEVLFVQDLNSSNGTIVEHGARRYKLHNGAVRQLNSKDKIEIAGITIQIFLFRIDKRYFNKKRR